MLRALPARRSANLCYINTTVALAAGGKVDVDGGRIGADATYFDRGFHVDASVSGGPNSYATRRATPNNTFATGNADGSEVTLLLATGYGRPCALRPAGCRTRHAGSVRSLFPACLRARCSGGRSGAIFGELRIDCAAQIYRMLTNSTPPPHGTLTK